MASEPGKPQEKTPAPSRKVRLAWWFGIYLAGQMSLIFHYGLLCAILVPTVLGMPLFLILPKSLPVPILFTLTSAAGYALYLVHLYIIVKVRTRRSFDFLLLLLVIIVLTSQFCILPPID